MPAARKTTKGSSEATAPAIDCVTAVEAKRRAEVAKAAVAELELAERRGELVRVADIIALWPPVVRALRDRFRGLGARLAPLLAVPDLDERDVLRIVSAEVDVILREIPEALPMPEPKRGGR